MPWVRDADGMETWQPDAPEAAAPEEPGIGSKIWSRLVTPITEQVGLPKLDFGEVAQKIFNPRGRPMPAPKDKASAWLRGAAEKFTGTTSGLASGTVAPLNLALMGGGAALPRLAEAARAASEAGDVARLNNILRLINVVRGGEVAGGATVAGHGAVGLATAETWPERGFSIAELLMGGLGLRGGLKGPRLPEPGRVAVPDLAAEAPTVAAETSVSHAAGRASTRAAFKEALAEAGVEPVALEHKTAAELGEMLKAKGVDPGTVVIKRLRATQAPEAAAEVAPPEEVRAESAPAPEEELVVVGEPAEVPTVLDIPPGSKPSIVRTPTSPAEPTGAAGAPPVPPAAPPSLPPGGAPPSTPPPEMPAGASAPAPRPPMADTRLPGGGNPELTQETQDALRGLFKRQTVGRYNANVLNLQLHAKQAQIIRKYQDMVRGGAMNPVDAQHAQMQELKGLAAGIEDLPAGLKPEQFREAMQYINQKDWTMDRFAQFRAANALQSAVEHGTQLQANELKLMERIFGRPVVAGNPSWFGKFLEHLFKTHSTMRALVASADLSATMRQALVATVSHPGLAAKAMGAQLRALASESQYRLIQGSIFNNPMRQLQQESGLFLAERGGYKSLYDTGLGSVEEVYGGAYRWAEKLPWVGRSERAYITYLNKLRSDLFNKKAYDMMRQFQQRQTPEAQQMEAFKDLARAVNTMTGRGEISLMNVSRGSLLGKVTGEVQLGREAGERALPFLNSVFFAPRFMASRLSMLRDLPLLYSNYSAPVRNEMLKDVTLTVLTGLSGLASVAALTGAEVEWDPTSTDFAKLKVGDTRIDPWGGFQPWVRFLSQMYFGERKSVKTGLSQQFGPGFGQTSRLDAAINFMLQKASPAASVGADLMRGARFNGEQLTFLDDQFPWVGKDVWNRIAPMVWQDVYDAFNEGSVEQLALVVPADLLGMSAQTYDPWDPVSRPTQKVGP